MIPRPIPSYQIAVAAGNLDSIAAYNLTDALSHLNVSHGELGHLGRQGPKQLAMGPLQDEEALFLFALVRVTQVARILEIGGLIGDSARNFLAALRTKPNAKMYTIDVNHVRSQDRSRHRVIRKDAAQFDWQDIDGRPVDLIFLDCHNFRASQQLVQRVVNNGMLHPAGYIVLHDTGLHPRKYVQGSLAWPNESVARPHWIHQPVERLLATWIETQHGWHRISAHDDDRMPYRHGLTVMQHAVDLGVPEDARVQDRTHYFGKGGRKALSGMPKRGQNFHGGDY